jgi:hypothetical protein
MASTIAANSTRQSRNNIEDFSSNCYALFKFSIRTEVTRKYYERRIRQFLDFIEFNPEDDIEKRSNAFACTASHELKWTVENIIRFLQFQKNRVENGDITAATLRNYVKSIKSFCDACDITIPWRKITRGLPRGRQASTDRTPTIEILSRPSRWFAK